MAEQRNGSTVQFNLASEDEDKKVTSRMFEFVDSLQIYLSTLNDELSELKRVRRWALPILQKVDTADAYDGTPGKRSCVHVRIDSEGCTGTEKPLSTAEGVGTL